MLKASHRGLFGPNSGKARHEISHCENLHAGWVCWARAMQGDGEDEPVESNDGLHHDIHGKANAAVAGEHDEHETHAERCGCAKTDRVEVRGVIMEGASGAVGGLGQAYLGLGIVERLAKPKRIKKYPKEPHVAQGEVEAVLQHKDGPVEGGHGCAWQGDRRRADRARVAAPYQEDFTTLSDI